MLPSSKIEVNSFNWTLWNDKKGSGWITAYEVTLLIGPCGMISNKNIFDFLVRISFNWTLWNDKKDYQTAIKNRLPTFNWTLWNDKLNR